MEKALLKNRPFFAAVLSSIIAALVVAGINYLVAHVFKDQILAAFVATIIGSGILLLSIRLQVVNPLEAIGARYLDQNTGIVKIYPSYKQAESDMKEAFEKAKRADMLIYIGRREFGPKDPSFSDILKNHAVKGPEKGAKVRILHIDPDSPYLSEMHAKRLGKRVGKWRRDTNNVRGHIDELREDQNGEIAAHICVAFHKEPFAWRLFIFDDEMFVSGYLYDTGNDVRAPVFKLKEGENSLFTPFNRYYEHLWRVYGNN